MCVGAVSYATPPLTRAASVVAGPTRRIGGVLMRPPLVPSRFTPAHWLDTFEAQGRQVRGLTTAGLVTLTDEMVPALASAVLARLDPIELVKQTLDHDQVERELDLLVPFATEAILSRVEPVTLIEANLRPEQVEKLLDLYLGEVTTAVLARLDLTELVRRHVGLTSLTRDVLADIDLVGITELVIAELDLADIAQGVIDDIDLPSIIRASSTGVASDMVGDTRQSAASADDAVSAFFGRLRGSSSRDTAGP